MVRPRRPFNVWNQYGSNRIESPWFRCTTAAVIVFIITGIEKHAMDKECENSPSQTVVKLRWDIGFLRDERLIPVLLFESSPSIYGSLKTRSPHVFKRTVQSLVEKEMFAHPDTDIGVHSGNSKNLLVFPLFLFSFRRHCLPAPIRSSVNFAREKDVTAL
jgi:hypothetical protein